MVLKSLNLVIKGGSLKVKNGNVQVTAGDVVVRNGLKDTETVNGCGNVIIGYNELRIDQENDRSGSHMLVVGEQHNYSSYGGMVAGSINTISREYATVTGGQANVASGRGATVSGGVGNSATQFATAVLGGFMNTACPPTGRPCCSTGEPETRSTPT